ncbi:hypothetical protein GCM10010261_22890 [Streptomyces pilosus]|uniref:Uncharacterized protein n=1 Tax=Streptomyces pilosus TaxID=28893 RepID=A0A918F0M1_9ACTN|nr:hypothetical protein GCM10010280_46950 [Streptomyces pilosus]GGV47111.1 hypothetical protein GCM10010261_22890 [Streptomyces pilosus]
MAHRPAIAPPGAGRCAAPPPTGAGRSPAATAPPGDTGRYDVVTGPAHPTPGVASRRLPRGRPKVPVGRGRRGPARCPVRHSPPRARTTSIDGDGTVLREDLR